MRTDCRRIQERRAAQEAMVFMTGTHTGHGPKDLPPLRGRHRKAGKGKSVQACKDIHSIGFNRADNVARAMGIDLHPLRMAAGCIHALKEATNDGHCLPRNALTERAAILEVDEARQEALKELEQTERGDLQSGLSTP